MRFGLRLWLLSSCTSAQVSLSMIVCPQYSSCSRISVIHEKLGVWKSVFRCVFSDDGFLIGNAVALPLKHIVNVVDCFSNSGIFGKLLLCSFVYIVVHMQ